MTAEPHASHGLDELCEAGSALYARALREGRVPREDAGQAPCLLDSELLYPEVEAPHWLRPTSPAVALPRIRETIHGRIAAELRREGRLAARFQLLAEITPGRLPAPAPSSVTTLNGLPEINEAITKALAASSREALAVQPGGARLPEALAQSLANAQGLLSRGGRMRTLYQHTTRHSLPVLAYYEQLKGDTEVRTLDEVTERLFVFDRTVAFIPASKDRTQALEVRHPALVDYFTATFWRLWRMATPMYPQTAPQPAENGITTRQHAIAGLLVEGLTDAEIATRLGMNIRTARVHIAKLAATLGSNSRAQLGYLIGQSGILDRPQQDLRSLA
ncbi:helix-turn-helix transcriptional regulator [Streptomyces sp. NPDC050732]|uniref:helix-turn-helix transcriptional regulator n=1 Tax=Streptomyces sp. NPDC050732 TaxID=3154632 RepID=UPI0034142151